MNTEIQVKFSIRKLSCLKNQNECEHILTNHLDTTMCWENHCLITAILGKVTNFVQQCNQLIHGFHLQF